MKGISHFVSGIAIASCFPPAVAAGAGMNPLYFILGGIAGLLPDTLDFRFSRFLYGSDVRIIPDPLVPDPGMIAEGIARSLDRAVRTHGSLRLKLDTIRLSSHAWQRYAVKFDVANRRVVVEYGPVVDTGGRRLTGMPADGEGRTASAPFCCKLKVRYMATVVVDVFSGPTFRLALGSDDTVDLHFIPWHRQWSHSLVIGLLAALTAWSVWGVLAGAVVFGAYGAHILMDQLGFMGSNLYFPFSRRRTPGLKLMHSGDSRGNFLTVWSGCLLVFWNMYRGMNWPVSYLDPAKLVFYCLVVPVCAVALIRRLMPRPGA